MLFNKKRFLKKLKQFNCNDKLFCELIEILEKAKTKNILFELNNENLCLEYENEIIRIKAKIADELIITKTSKLKNVESKYKQPFNDEDLNPFYKENIENDIIVSKTIFYNLKGSYSQVIKFISKEYNINQEKIFLYSGDLCQIITRNNVTGQESKTISVYSDNNHEMICDDWVFKLK
ncbi:MAG: hypothetical protein ACK5HP_02980 [Bacilli bacterium]